MSSATSARALYPVSVHKVEVYVVPGSMHESMYTRLHQCPINDRQYFYVTQRLSVLYTSGGWAESGMADLSCTLPPPNTSQAYLLPIHVQIDKVRHVQIATPNVLESHAGMCPG